MDEYKELYEEIKHKMIENTNIHELQDIFDYDVQDGEIKSTTPCEPVSFVILNFSNKRISAGWIDYDGNANPQSSFGSKNLGSSITLGTYTNHCYRIILDADDPHSEKLDFKIPTDKSICCLGDKNLINKQIDNSSWINNEKLSMNHFSQLLNLFNIQKSPSTNSDLKLIRNFYYDESPETENLIQSFFDAFNEEKFIDPFFNPLNKFDPNGFTLRRTSEFKVTLLKEYNPSVYLGKPFNFEIINDLDTAFVVFWIDYAGKAKSKKKYFFKKEYATLNKNSTVPFKSYLGNVWAVSNKQQTYFFELGKAPFNVNNSKAKISQINNVHDLDIENYEGESIDSIIIDKDDLEKYNSRQGQIGNCWFLQVIVSIYARYPEQITSKFIKPELMNQTGIVVVKLWSKYQQCWRLVVMDDYLPCHSNLDWYGSSPSGPSNNRFWVPFLEKAFAKQVECFDNLTANKCNISVRNEYEMILGPLMKDFKTISIPEIDKDYVAFNEMLESYKRGDVISFSSRSSKNNQLIDNVTRMVSYHGYGLLEIRENVDNTGMTFIKAQNTWSKDGEWAGNWGDESPIWNKYPNIKRELNYENSNDGAFWIEKKDFSKAFSVLWIAIV